MVPERSVGFGAQGGAVSVTVTLGSRLAISMPANPSTGYQWIAAADGDDRGLSLSSTTYIESASKPSKVGAGIQQYMVYIAEQTGDWNIRLEYLRPWETHTNSTAKIVVHVSVIHDGVDTL
jgi:predicted secreted protein